MTTQQILSTAQAMQKLRHYCAYQERCHKEVKEKLYGFGLHRKEVDESIAQLIEENYLNEERFAIHFAGGKFRMKHWGKNKIKHELKLRQVSEYCIKKALNQLGNEDYMVTLNKLAEEKWTSLKREKNIFIKKRKTQAFLMQKGYESDLVTGLEIFSKKS